MVDLHMKSSRRHFFKSAGMTAAGFFGIQKYLSTEVSGQSMFGRSYGPQEYQSEVDRYGKLIKDPNRLLDLSLIHI